MWLYYGGNNGKHTDWRDGFFCLAHLRPDGFAGMEATGEGLLVTRPLEWKGGPVRINADARGSVVVKAVDGERVVAESRPLSGDLTEATVKWRKPPAMIAKPMRLRFELKDAKLYSFALA